jgi:flagellar hook-associated protein 3 FlgL
MNRITLPGVYGKINIGVTQSQDRLAKAYMQITSGKRVLAPSDDPVGTLQIMQLRRDNAMQVQHERSTTDANQILTALDAALQDSSTVITQAVERLAQAGGYAGQDVESREAIAVDLENLRDELLSIANRTHVNRPLFSGTSSPNPTFDSTGTYLGNASPIMRDIGTNETIAVTIPGDQVFGTGVTGIIGALNDAATAVRNGDAAGRVAAQQAFEAGLDTFGVAQTQVGARMRRVEMAAASITLRLDQNTDDISQIEDIDFEEAATQLRALELTYQATLAAAGRVAQFTLLDFLR